MRGAGTLLRGLRSRALLSLGSLLLVALAIGATVLGPVFQDASVRSYVVDRVDGADDLASAVTWEVSAPRGGADLGALTAEAVAEVRTRLPDVYVDPDVSWWAGPFTDPDLPLPATVVARDDACDVLTIRGGCPTRPGEVLVSVEEIGSRQVGDTVVLPELGEQTIVGVYTAPTTSERWLLPTRLAHVNAGPTRPARPAPYVVTRAAVAATPPESWQVILDSRVDVPDDLDADRLDTIVRDVDALADLRVRLPDGGDLRAGTDLNALDAVLADARLQGDAARSAVMPAVVSLVLVVLAILLRLLTAAADQRVPELTLAALRGAPRRRQWALGLSEPAGLVAVGVPAGLALGWAAALATAHAWLRPGLPVRLPAVSWLGAGVVTVLLVGTAVLAVRRSLAETLGERLGGVRRPSTGHSTGPSADRVAQVVELLVLAFAVVLPLARLGGDDARGLDLVTLLLPVVQAVAAGLLVTRLVRVAAGWWSRRRTGGPIAVFVAARSLSRRAESTLVMLPVTAAVAVSVFAVGVGGAAADWRASVAATRTPAAVVYDSPLSLGATRALSQRLDPAGDYLMAAGEVTTTAGLLVAVDSSRLGSVARWSDEWLDGATGADVGTLLSPQPAPRLVGDRVSLTLTNDTREAASTAIQVGLDVFTGDGDTRRVTLGPFGPGTSSDAVRAPCADGCDVRSVSLGGPAVSQVPLHGSVRLDRLTAASGDVPLGALRDADERVRTDGAAAPTLQVDTGTGGVATLVSPTLSQRLRVVLGSASGETITDGPDGPELGSLTGGTPVEVVARARSVPLLGPRGVLVDLSALVQQVSVADELTTPRMLVTADAPDDVVAGLAAAGLTEAGRYDDTLAALDDTAYAQALRLYRAVGLAILGAALLGLLVSFAVQLPGRRRDAAALRVVGVRRRTVGAAVLCEVLVTLAASALAGLAAGVLAEALVMRSLTLGVVDDLSTPPVLPGVELGRVAGFAALVVLGLVALTLAAGLAVLRGARGATLGRTAR